MCLDAKGQTDNYLLTRTFNVVLLKTKFKKNSFTINLLQLMELVENWLFYFCKNQKK